MRKHHGDTENTKEHGENIIKDGNSNTHKRNFI